VPEITAEIRREITMPRYSSAVEPLARGTAASAGESAAPPPAARPRPAAVVPPRGAIRPPVGFVDRGESIVLGGAPTPVGLVKVERDDAAVLRELRLEVIAVAEAAYATATGSR
jgi:hypothetical protein